MSIFRHLTFILSSLGIALVAMATEQPRSAGLDPQQSSASKPSPLVDKVRQATRRFRDINVAIAEGWVQGTPCVSGPNEGAMGVHFVLPARIGDGVLNADEPEALIYEPMPSGALRLVSVEFIVLASDWAAKNPGGGAPTLDGHLTNYVAAPNRYGLPAFHELHVWAWERNPKGSFADWNTLVTCERQPAG